MTDPTKKISYDNRSALANITNNKFTISNTELSNGLDIVDFFANVDNSGALTLTNVSTVSAAVTIKAGEGIRAGIGDAVITVPASQQITKLIDDSSRFGSILEDVNGKTYLGLSMVLATTCSGMTGIATCKKPVGYVAPDITP